MKESMMVALLCTALAFGFVGYYSWSRKSPMPKNDRVFLLKLTFCFLFNFLSLSVFSDPRKSHGIDAAMSILIFVIADIDLLIGKIPTELLALLFLLTMTSGDVALEKAAGITIICAAACLFRNKIGIALYDVLLFGLLGLRLPGINSFFRYMAVSLILWGVSGLILRPVTKGKARTIPLAPVFTFALLVENFV